MMNPHLLSWKKHRVDINSSEFFSGLEKANTFWETGNFSPYYLNWDEPEHWPDPWTLVSENIFCDLAKSLAILYTLYFTDYKLKCEFELRLYKCDKTGYEYNLIWIDDGKYILNYSSTIVNKEQLQENLKLIKTYSVKDLGLDKY